MFSNSGASMMIIIIIIAQQSKPGIKSFSTPDCFTLRTFLYDLPSWELLISTYNID